MNDDIKNRISKMVLNLHRNGVIEREDLHVISTSIGAVSLRPSITAQQFEFLGGLETTLRNAIEA
jgi:hypothetical protein